MPAFTLRDPLEAPFVPGAALSPYEAEALTAQRAILKGQSARDIALGPAPADLKGYPGPRRKETYRAHRRERDKAHKDDPLAKDFRNFLFLIWRHLGLPVPSPVQLSLAWWLQHGPSRAVILGFRGMAKSWITGAFILWNLYCDPQRKILVVSASLDRAVQTVQWCLALIRSVPELQHLCPGPLQRQSGKQFDVGPALPDQSPSLRGAGITGQITGSRAHLIVPDDVEIPANSMTVLMREKISETVKEFDAILHPGGLVKFLGTPQTDDSLYPKLSRRGYTIRIWPAEYPDKKQRIKYGDRLSPFILNRVERDPTLVGHSVWPERFPDDDLAARKLSYGRSGYALQFLLDTSLSDADRYPLKLKDLIVMDLDLVRGPDVIAWGTDQKNIMQGLPLMGFEGDRFYGPASEVLSFSEYTNIKAFCDPSGKGADETSMSIGAELHGRCYVLFNGAWRDGYSPATLKHIALACVFYKVKELVVEDNFGDGMFVQLLTPYMTEAWKTFNETRPQAVHGGTSIEGVRSQRTQKELRILSALEGVTQGHRLVVAKSVIENDYKSLATIDGDELRAQYSLFHQYSHLTRERDCLLHDDRLESLAGMVSLFSDMLGINPWDSAARAHEDKLEEELEKLLNDADDVGDCGVGRGGKSSQRPAAVSGDAPSGTLKRPH